MAAFDTSTDFPTDAGHIVSLRVEDFMVHAMNNVSVCGVNFGLKATRAAAFIMTLERRRNKVSSACGRLFKSRSLTEEMTVRLIEQGLKTGKGIRKRHKPRRKSSRGEEALLFLKVKERQRRKRRSLAKNEAPSGFPTRVYSGGH